MKNYVYKAKNHIKKTPEILARFGFERYRPIEDENKEGILEDSENIYARGIKLDINSPISKNIKRMLEKVYMQATTEEREKDFGNYAFKYIVTEDQKDDVELIITPEIEKELTECQLCFVDKGETAWMLFINDPLAREQYGSLVLDECVKDIVDNLMKNRVIYKARIWGKRK